MTKNQKSKKTKRVNTRQHIWLWAGLCGFIVLGVIAYFYYTPPGLHPSQPASEAVKAGARLYRQNCATCHGPGAGGEDPERPMGGMKADGSYISPALNGAGHAWHHPDELLFDIIKNGSGVEGSTMHGFRENLTDEEIVEVIRYFKSFWSKKIIKLRAQRFQQKRGGRFTAGAETLFSEGEAVYNKHCSVCHGEKGAGTDTGPPLVHKIYHPNHHADVSFHLAVKTGVRAHHWKFGNMPKVEGVSKEETDMIIKYVRDLQKEAGIY